MNESNNQYGLLMSLLIGSPLKGLHGKSSVRFASFSPESPMTSEFLTETKWIGSKSAKTTKDGERTPRDPTSAKSSERNLRRRNLIPHA